MIHFLGTGPQSRLSALSPRLSPIMKKWPGGTVIGFGKLQSARTSRPRDERLLRALAVDVDAAVVDLDDDPVAGEATTRLMKLLSDCSGVGVGQARLVVGCSDAAALCVRALRGLEDHDVAAARDRRNACRPG